MLYNKHKVPRLRRNKKSEVEEQGVTGLVIFLFIAGGISILGKLCGAIGRFFRPTTNYINQCMINALVRGGMSRQLAIALLPVLKVMLAAGLITFLIWSY